MFFSIVVPTYNRAGFIQNTIQSILVQSYARFEIIIVDDGSTDNTSEVVKSIKDDRIYYFKKENAERGAARNFGIEKANGDYITFLDSDDYILKNYFENALTELVRFNYPPFFHQGYQIVNSSGRVLTKINFIKNYDYKLLAESNPFSCMGVFIRKDILKKHRFNEDRRLAGSEDWEFWLRLSANYGFVTSNKITACLVNHDNRSVINYNEQSLVSRKELSLKYAFTDENVKRVFGRYYKKMNASVDTYIALHLLLSGKKRESLKYLMAYIQQPQLIFRRRTLAIIKYFLKF